jgi:hypothetical protein
MTTEEKSNQNLIKCEACNKDISTLADKCPGCGAPNNWIHPNIKHFLSMKDQTGMSKRFIFHRNKTEIWGETAVQGLPWYVWIAVIFSFLILLWLGGMFSGIIFGAMFESLVILIGGGYVVFKVARKFTLTKNFKANLQLGTWWSDDDDFWLPVRSILKV